MTIAIDDATAGEIVDIDLHGEPDLSEVDLSDDGSSVTIYAALMDTEDTGTVTVSTASVRRENPAENGVTLHVEALGDESGESYDVVESRGATLAVGPDNGDSPENSDAADQGDDENGASGEDTSEANGGDTSDANGGDASDANSDETPDANGEDAPRESEHGVAEENTERSEENNERTDKPDTAASEERITVTAADALATALVEGPGYGIAGAIGGIMIALLGAGRYLR